MEQYNEWDQFSGKVFISDLCQENEIIDSEGKTITLGRYAVWSPMANGARHQIVEVGSDLAELQNKYNISDEYVLQIIIPQEQ